MADLRLSRSGSERERESSSLADFADLMIFDITPALLTVYEDNLTLYIFEMLFRSIALCKYLYHFSVTIFLEKCSKCKNAKIRKINHLLLGRKSSN